MIPSVPPRALIAGFAGLALAACSSSSGSGDGDPPPTTNAITPQNATQLASSATNSLSGLLDLTGAPLGFIGGEGLQGFQGTGDTEVIDCTEGGTVTVTITDLPPVDEPSAGDNVDVEFADCTEDGTTINGSLSATIDQFEETETTFLLGFTIVVPGLTLVEEGRTFSQDGTLSQTIDSNTKSGDFGYAVAGFFNSSADQGGATLTSNLSGLDLRFDFIADVEMQTIHLDATYDTNIALQTSFTLTTLADFVIFGLDSNPVEGQLSIAAEGDTLYLTAQPDGEFVLLELDQGSDGTIDWEELVLWDDL